MKRLTKTYLDGTHGASDSLPCGENSYDYKNLLIEKLGKYEDLEERLNKVYGDCDGLLESMIELLEEHSGVDIPDDTVKALLLTNKAVDFYKECEDLDVQDRLVKLPCKVGDTVYKPNPVTLKEIVEIKIDSMFITETNFNISGRTTKMKYSFCCTPKDFGKTVFLTKSEAEAKLKGMRGGKDEERS